MSGECFPRPYNLYSQLATLPVAFSFSSTIYIHFITTPHIKPHFRLNCSGVTMFAQRPDKAFPTNVSDHIIQLQGSYSQRALSPRTGCNDRAGSHPYSTMKAQNSTTYSGQAAPQLEASQADVTPKISKRLASCKSEVGCNNAIHQVWSSSTSSPSSPASSAYSGEGGSSSIQSSLPSEEAASHLSEASPVYLFDANLTQPCFQDYLTPTSGLGLVDLVPANSPQAQPYSQVSTRYQNSSSTIAHPYTPSEYIYASNKGYLAESNITQCRVAYPGSVDEGHESLASSQSLDLRYVSYPVRRSHLTQMPLLVPIPAHRQQHTTERLTCLSGASSCEYSPRKRPLGAPTATPHLLQAPFGFSPESDCNFAVGGMGVPHDYEPASVGYGIDPEEVYRSSVSTSSSEETALSQGTPYRGLLSPRHDCRDLKHPFITGKHAESGHIALGDLHHPKISHDSSIPTSYTLPVSIAQLYMFRLMAIIGN